VKARGPDFEIAISPCVRRVATRKPFSSDIAKDHEIPLHHAESLNNHTLHRTARASSYYLFYLSLILFVTLSRSIKIPTVTTFPFFILPIPVPQIWRECPNVRERHSELFDKSYLALALFRVRHSVSLSYHSATGCVSTQLD
jgi:hypothetical protein